jgi:hypothetical protein
MSEVPCHILQNTTSGRSTSGMRLNMPAVPFWTLAAAREG